MNYILFIKTKNQEGTRYFHAFACNSLEEAKKKEEEVKKDGIIDQEVIYTAIQEGRKLVDEEHN